MDLGGKFWVSNVKKVWCSFKYFEHCIRSRKLQSSLMRTLKLLGTECLVKIFKRLIKEIKDGNEYLNVRIFAFHTIFYVYPYECWKTYYFLPTVRLSVRPSACLFTKSCPIFNLKTIQAIFTKRNTHNDQH